MEQRVSLAQTGTTPSNAIEGLRRVSSALSVSRRKRWGGAPRSR
jgi:hypothetical protein